MPWPLPEGREARLALALGYPYPAPDSSYLFVGGEARPLEDDSGRFHDRIAVLAHGSNRAPEQLRRKYGDRAEIPVTYGRLHDYDIVFAAHVARYGAVTSTVAHAPGCRVRVAVTWLTEEQLARMHETERMNYSYGHFPAGAFRPEAGPEPAALTAYLGNRGPLEHEGSAVAFATAAAEGRRFPAMLQAELQQILHARHLSGEDLANAILARIAEPAKRRAFEETLKSGAAPDAIPGFELIERLDD